MSEESTATFSKVEAVLHSIQALSPNLNFILSLQTMASNYLFGLIFTDDTKRVDASGQIGIEDTRLWLIGIVVTRLVAVKILSKVLRHEWPWKTAEKSTDSTSRHSRTRYLLNTI